MSADLRARIAELEAELAEAKADGERGWADAQRREDDEAMWAKTSRRFHEEWKAAEAELEQALAAVERVREVLDYFDGQIIALESGNPAVGSAFRFTFTKIRAALDQAPAAEQDGGGR